MPRGRFISREISLDEKVNALSDDTARLLFTWLIPHLDCEGRLHGDPITVKSIVFPRRKISVLKIDKYLNEIAKLGLILRYSVDGNAYLLAPHFEKHQLGLQKSKEAQSQIPPPPPELLQSNSRITPPQVKVKAKAKVKVVPAQQSTSENFEVFWKAYPKRKSKGHAEKVFAKINPDEQLLATMLATIERAKKSVDWQKDDGQYIPYPATWLNAKGWEDEIKKGGRSGTHKQSSRQFPKHEDYRPPEVIFPPEDDG